MKEKKCKEMFYEQSKTETKYCYSMYTNKINISGYCYLKETNKRKRTRNCYLKSRYE